MGKSLRLRLAVAAALSIVMALVIAGFGLAAIFERHVIRRVEAELETHLRQLAAEIAIAPDGTLLVQRQPSDPRFESPLSGFYWQAELEGGQAALRSRSLWDHALELPARKAAPGIVESHVVPGPGATTLMAATRTIAYPRDNDRSLVRLAVAIDRADIVQARRDFVDDVSVSLLLLSVVLIIASWMQIAIGLQPLEAMRQNVNRVRSGHDARLGVEEPTEVMPLVAEVNSLLDAQDKAIEQARQRAADLAHGLKTPLQVLTMDAERLRAKGEGEMASEIEELAAGMRRHVGRELSRARLHPSGKAVPHRTGLADAVERLVRVLARGPRGPHLRFEVDIADDAMVAMSPSDLIELVGNILDNAVKWAESLVQVRARLGTEVQLSIEDDGQGVSPDLLDKLGRRGVRLDQSVEGTGLGLAIACDIVDAYGARITFGNRTPKGFSVTIAFPLPR